MTGWLTLKEAAERLGLAVNTLQWQVKKGRLEAVLRGHTLFVTEEAVEAYRRDHLGRHGADKRRKMREEQENG